MDKFTSVSVWNEERVDNTSATDKRKHIINSLLTSVDGRKIIKVSSPPFCCFFDFHSH